MRRTAARLRRAGDPSGLLSDVLTSLVEASFVTPATTSARGSRPAQLAERPQQRVARLLVGRGLRRLVQRSDQPAHVLEVARASVALREMGIHPHAVALRER